MAVPDGYKALAKIGISYKGEYGSTVTYENLDAVYYKGSTYLALIDSPLGVPNDDGTNWKYLAQGFGSDVSAATVDFEEASERENIETGETIKTVFGKAKKWFADLTAAAFAQMITSYADIMANTTSGHLVDALAVKEGYESINNNLSDTGWVDNGNVKYRVKAGVVYIKNAVQFNPSTTSAVVASIPEQYAPPETMCFAGYCGSYGANNMAVTVDTNGGIAVIADANYSYGRFTISYPI